MDHTLTPAIAPLATSSLEDKRPKWIALPQLLEFLGRELNHPLAESTLIQWRKRGCPYLQLSSRCLRYDPVAVMDWIIQEKLVKARFGNPKRTMAERLAR